jgi:hypothetical protein
MQESRNWLVKIRLFFFFLFDPKASLQITALPTTTATQPLPLGASNVAAKE